MHVWTLLTAMPTTVGHVALLDFMHYYMLGVSGTVVIHTQPDEPDILNRVEALRTEATERGLLLIHDARDLERNPDAADFKQMWVDNMRDYGFDEGDILITSEPYGEWLAAGLGGTWIPYDIKREVVPVKATDCRDRTRLWHPETWSMLAPAYKDIHRKTVTTFGAESTGKTTTAKSIAKEWNGAFKPEWARGYLEAVGPEVTNEKMLNIWRGQKALQRMRIDKPFIVQDTDLYSTIGYWRMYDPDYYSTIKDRIEKSAWINRSDLYILCPSDIPFEPDQLRYGGDKRESNDQYWIDLLEEFNLPYVIHGRNPNTYAVGEALHNMLPDLTYERKGY